MNFSCVFSWNKTEKSAAIDREDVHLLYKVFPHFLRAKIQIQLTQLVHENVNQFIGICTQEQGLCRDAQSYRNL